VRVPTEDEACRAVVFLDTGYYDDVWPTRRHEDDAVEPVAVDAGEVVAILDLSFAIDGPVLRATIDTVAVDSVHRRHGLADALLDRGLDAVRRREGRCRAVLVCRERLHRTVSLPARARAVGRR